MIMEIMFHAYNYNLFAHLPLNFDLLKLDTHISFFFFFLHNAHIEAVQVQENPCGDAVIFAWHFSGFCQAQDFLRRVHPEAPAGTCPLF